MSRYQLLEMTNYRRQRARRAPENFADPHVWALFFSVLKGLFNVQRPQLYFPSN